MPRRSSTLLAAASTLLALTAVSCGDDTPAGPTTPPVVVQPTPVPTPAPTPAPTPPGTDVGSSCSLGPGTLDTSCERSGSTHLREVQEAIDRVVASRPGLFDLQDENGEGSGQYRVLDPEAYLDAVVAELTTTSACAQRALDGETIQVKDNNSLSEDFDVLLSSGHIRRNAYVSSCQPAAFPVGPADVIYRVRVAFWSFECNPGVVAPGNHDRLLPRDCDGRVTATPKDRDGRDVPLSIHGPDIEWELRRGADAVEVLDDWRFPNPFNKVLQAKVPNAPFQLCATVQGIEGCLSGNTVP